MATVEPNRHNEYTNSMFRYEHVSEPWIDSCTRYLRLLFGDSLQGKTVIDYACGRGNWSLAFSRLGAARVIAIDASTARVAAFSDYCRAHRTTGIEVVAGNILDEPVAARADLVWLYGILPVVADPAALVERVTSLARGPDARAYVYQYNAGSLREFTVQTCRAVTIYENEAAFRRDSYLFIRPARMRASDDLCAPAVNFSTAAALRDLLRRSGLHVVRQDSDFQTFLGRTTEDFYPHQFLCAFRPGPEPILRETPPPYAAEVRILDAIARDVFALRLGQDERKRIAIGLYNTHFAFLSEDGGARNAVVEICLFLLYVLLQHDADEERLSPQAGQYYRLFRLALAREDWRRHEDLLAGLGHNVIVDYLVSGRLRS